jgi:tetratricopeptide (TPR) repeat protein
MKMKYLILAIFFSLLFLNIPFVYAETAQEYVHLGNVSGKQEKYKEAIRDYTKAIEADPNLADAYYNRGYVYIEMRKYKKAIADLDKAIELDAKYAPAYHVRGIAYFLKKKYTQAIADYDTAIELDPDNLRYYISRMSANFKLGYKDRAWKDVIKIQQLGGTVDPTIINILKEKKYRDKE